MKMSWTTLKNLIAGYKGRKGLFLSLLDAEGNILCANATMLKTLGMKNPRITQTSFLELLHPVNFDHFKYALKHCSENDHPVTTELIIKNGHYHPMKWEISRVYRKEGNDVRYLCAGEQLLDSRRMEAFNRLGEKNYQLIVESLPSAFLFQEKNGELIFANQKTAEIFSTTLQKLYALQDIKTLWNGSWDITNGHGERVFFDDAPFMRAARLGRFQTDVLEIKIRNGEIRRVQFCSQPIFEKGSREIAAVVSGINEVTQETELFNLMQERVALFNVFMKHTPNLAWVVDEEFNLLHASRAFYKYFGLDENSVTGKSIIELVPPEVSNALYERHVQALASGAPVELIKKVMWGNGQQFVFLINILPIEGIKGRKMLAGYAINIAEKQEVEKQLRETNERLLLLTRTTSDAIWEWDMQSGHIFRNDALMDMIGYQPLDSKGLSWWLRCIHPEDRNRVADKVRDSADAGLQSWEDEYRFKCADGTYKQMHDRGFIVYENGLPVKMIGSLHDVTELKKLENELTEERLKRQREISETVIRVQEKERTRIGHELHDNVNQILSTTKLFVDLLTPANEEEKMIKRKSVEYLLLAIEEIRKLSRELVTPQLENKGLVESIMQLIEDIRISTSIKIKFVHDHDIDLLRKDKRITLFRIVQEQLKNILKYSQAQNVDIILQCKGDGAVLAIRDNGVGFDTRQPVKGIGIANMQERIRFYNGEMKIESAPGKGCLLEVSLPQHDQK